MKIQTETSKKIFTTDNKEIKTGDTCVIMANGVAMVGVFKGITKYSSLEFSFDDGIEVMTFRLMPKSIGAIWKADVMLVIDRNNGGQE